MKPESHGQKDGMQKGKMGRKIALLWKGPAAEKKNQPSSCWETKFTVNKTRPKSTWEREPQSLDWKERHRAVDSWGRISQLEK